MSVKPVYQITNSPGTLKVEVPPWWTVTITAISRRDYKQLVHVTFPNGKKRFASKLGQLNDTMRDTFNGATSWSRIGRNRNVTLDLSFYYSLQPASDNELDDKLQSNKVHVLTSSKPKEVSKEIPDFMTFLAFIEDAPDTQGVGVGQYSDVIVSVHCVAGLDDPSNPNPVPPPPPADTNPGYNPALDRKRPSTIDNYLRSYDTVFLIDDSGSMSGQKWDECCNALIGISEKAIDYDTDGIDIYFLNARDIIKVDIRDDKNRVKEAIKRVHPAGGTPTGARLRERLGEHINTLAKAVGTPAYREIKPLALVVITDGVPTDNPKDELVTAANRLSDEKHHPNAVGVQFVQIGNDPGADGALKELAGLRVNGIVDTVPYKTALTADQLQRILLGGLHPNIRVQ